MSKKKRIRSEREEERRFLIRGYLELGIRILVLFLVGYLVLTKVFLVTQAHGNEMFPAIKDGDVILAFRMQQDYIKNDVIVYENEGELHVGRILASGNDVVTLDDSGTLLVNGTVQSGEILFPTYAKEKLEYPYRVDYDHVFVLGDYRTQASDSRDYGAISMDDVKGKVITILRRRGI